jgi:hypothetical protein
MTPDDAHVFRIHFNIIFHLQLSLSSYLLLSCFPPKWNISGIKHDFQRTKIENEINSLKSNVLLLVPSRSSCGTPNATRRDGILRFFTMKEQIWLSGLYSGAKSTCALCYTRIHRLRPCSYGYVQFLSPNQNFLDNSLQQTTNSTCCYSTYQLESTDSEQLQQLLQSSRHTRILL